MSHFKPVTSHGRYIQQELGLTYFHILSKVITQLQMSGVHYLFNFFVELVRIPEVTLGHDVRSGCFLIRLGITVFCVFLDYPCWGFASIKSL